ncbi:hypothetical protein FN960_02460 [Alkalicoccobacillus porphyridii]|uniref:L-2-amino-thiazoline-4-carboxylic acid hydrolase n=2 Tax=Alkalicoccobacillus porphyridii TaxID=2597270 RepID=A0A554A4M5_9BACI|nr:hypothetical protein FN960_02460 [Alkalicoccobacillus porphyridii]
MESTIIEQIGQQAKPYITKGIRQFGWDRARKISNQATEEGTAHRLNDYLLSDPRAEDVDEQGTIYAWMAQLFAEVTKQVVDQYGDSGKDAVREAVRRFGEERGEGIAHRAAHLGFPNTIQHYLSNYDMGRSELFEFENVLTENNIEQTFTKCPFGEQWVEDGMGEYGILYCEMIDPAVAKGFNSDFEVEHDQYVIHEGVCHFHFSMNKKEGKQL